MAKKRNNSDWDYDLLDFGGDSVWVDRRKNRELNRAIEELERNKVNPAKVIKNLKQIIKQLQEEQEEIYKAANRKLSELQQRQREFQKRVVERFERDETRLDNIDNIIQESNSKLNEIRKDIDNIKVKERKEADRAEYLYKQACELYNYISQDNNSMYKKFAHADLIALRHDIETLQDSYNKGQLGNEAVQGSAFIIACNIDNLIISVNEKKLEFELLYSKALLMLEDLDNYVDNLKNNLYFDNEKNEKVDCNYWSFNHFDEIIQNINKLKSSIKSGYQSPFYQIEDLRYDIDNIKSIQNECRNMVEDVFIAYEMSFNREDMATVINKIMIRNFGFELVRHGFNNDDVRTSYITSLSRYTDDTKMEFYIIPDKDDPKHVVITYSMKKRLFENHSALDKFVEEFKKKMADYNIHFEYKAGENGVHIDPDLEFDKNTPITVPQKIQQILNN